MFVAGDSSLVRCLSTKHMKEVAVEFHFIAAFTSYASLGGTDVVATEPVS